MPKLTAKQEKFCQVYHATGSKTEAYRAAYNCSKMKEATIHNKAYALSNHGEIRARIEELKQAAQKRNETTVDTIDNMYKAAWKVAKDSNSPSAMCSAAGGLARLHGLDAETRYKINSGDDAESPALSINYSVAPPVGDVKITNAKTDS